MPAWLTWAVAALAGWTLVGLLVGLLLGQVFQRLGATSTTVTLVQEETEFAGWSAAPLTRAAATETGELLEPIPRSRSSRAS